MPKKVRISNENPTDWDIDYYRTEYESEEHWQLRRKFMEVHKTKFDEDRLVCLAQVFVNVEFMGCRYPAETMRLVGEMSQEVAKEFRAERANKLKRTFITASDAAEARAKGRKSMQQQKPTRPCFGTDASKLDDPTPQRAKLINLFEGLPFGKFVLILSGGRNCIRVSTQMAKVTYEERENCDIGQEKKVEIFINNNLVAGSVGESLKAAKANAFAAALQNLKECCYTIKTNPLRDTIKVDKSNNEVVCGITKLPSDGLGDKKLDETNKGYRMMKLMGWTGGGLGSQTQGRENPVSYLLKNNRSGLGNAPCALDRQYFRQMLRNYVESADIRELQFEPAFTKDERAALHEVAKSFSLKSTSHGKDEQRRLIISKRLFTLEHILTEVLVRKNERYCDQYFVQVPKLKANLFPDHTADLSLDM